MKGKVKSALTALLALSLVVTAVPGVSVYAKTKDKTKVEKTANNKGAGNRPIADGRYRIVTAMDDSKGMDLSGNNTVSQTNVQLYDITYNDTWFFDVKYMSGGYYKISVPDTNMCLDHAGAEQRDGANLWIYTNNDTMAQRWSFEDAGGGYFYIRSGVDNRCIDVQGKKTANRTNIMLQTKNGGDNQKWKFVGEEKPIKDGQYRIMSVMDGNQGLGPLNGNASEGTVLRLNDVSTNTVPLFDVKYDSKGFYRISVANTSLYLDEGDGGGFDGARLQLHANDTSSVYEKWRFVDRGDGTYTIRNGKDGRVIDVRGGTTNYLFDRVVYMYTHHGRANQRWTLVEDVMPKLEDITPFSMVGALRIRWGSELDYNNRLYKIDKKFPSGSSGKSGSSGSFFSASMSSEPAGIDVKYRENEEGASWKQVTLQAQNGCNYVDLTGLTPGVEYVFSIHPYYQMMFLGVPIGNKIYKQDWTKEQTRKTMEGNAQDIINGDNGHDTIASIAIANGWYAGTHTQLLSGQENNLYAMVCKNRDFQIWVGYQYIKGKMCYSWEISDYSIKKYKWVYRGTLADLKKDMATYGPGSNKIRLSTEYLKYKKGTEYTITVKNTSQNVTWSLPKHSNDRIKYGGVEIVKKTAKSITIRFVKVKGEWGVCPYIEAKIGNEKYKCRIESGSHPTW